MINKNYPKPKKNTQFRSKVKRDISIVLASLVLTTGIFAAKNAPIDMVDTNKQGIEITQSEKPEEFKIKFDVIKFKDISKRINQNVIMKMLGCNEIMIEKGEETKVKFKVFEIENENKNNPIYLDGIIIDEEVRKIILEMKSYIERTGKSVCFLVMEGKIKDNTTIEVHHLVIISENKEFVLIFKGGEINLSKN